MPENELVTAQRLGAAEDDRWMVRSTRLRTPLSAVGNVVRLIEQAYPGDTRLAYALQVLKRQTSFVNSLIDDLQEVVRSRVAKTVLRHQPIQLDELLSDVVETLLTATDEKEQHVSLVVPLTPIRLEGDPVRLRQTFLNLMQNAMKFSDRGTRIFVTCTVEAAEAVVKVEDQGRGIPPALLPRVFDALTRAESSPQALGLGLGAVAREGVRRAARRYRASEKRRPGTRQRVHCTHPVGSTNPAQFRAAVTELGGVPQLTIGSPLTVPRRQRSGRISRSM